MVYVPSGEYSIYTQKKRLYDPYIPSGEYSIYTQAPAGTYKPGGSTYTAPATTTQAAPAQQAPTVVVQQSGPDPAQAYYDWLKQQEEARQRRAQDSLIAQMREFMASNGMTDLLAGVEKYVRLGYTGDAVYFMVKNDSAYQAAYAKRFAANAERTKLGLPELSPATYIEMEQGYRTAMVTRGFPPGLFDSPDDFTALIAKDISVKEVEWRLDRALEYVNFSGNAAVRQQLRDIYGMTDQQMAAYMLDPQKTKDYLERESAKNLTRASVGGASQNALGSVNTSLRDQIAELMAATSPDGAFTQATQGFTEVAAQAPLYQRLAAYSGEIGTTDELVQEQFSLSGAAEVTNKKKVLASQERARFSGMSGLGSTSLSSGRKAQ